MTSFNTAWSSGTGLAGVFGYSWVFMFTVVINASFEVTLFCALILPVIYIVNFVFIMTPHNNNDSNIEDNAVTAVFSDPTISTKQEDVSTSSNASVSMTTTERFHNTLALWPFMVPLIVVYFSEYTMMSGVWACFGFPVDRANARDKFYLYSTWMYQFGVLISRSSGLVYKADMKAIWTMPILQTFLLIFFLVDAYFTLWYDWSILTLCFCVGLLGGGCYVGSFALLSETVKPSLKEFSLVAASLSADIGITCSALAGIFIQRALYRYHDIEDDE